MGKLSKKRAAEMAGVSVYRLNQDIQKGRLKKLAAGGVCAKSLSELYTVQDEALEPVLLAREPRPCPASTDQSVQVGANEDSPEPLHLRLIGKLEALLSLAERHRLMIEQQRRNIAMLNRINQRQERELQYLRRELNQNKQVEIQPWRRLIDRFSGPHRT